MDIVVVRAMADKRKLQGKSVCTIVAEDRSPRSASHIARGFGSFSFPHLSLTPAGEIDRCLKKVAEGVEQFEDIWQKVRFFIFLRLDVNLL